MITMGKQIVLFIGLQKTDGTSGNLPTRLASGVSTGAQTGTFLSRPTVFTLPTLHSAFTVHRQAIGIIYVRSGWRVLLLTGELNTTILFPMIPMETALPMKLSLGPATAGGIKMD
jgi:hypothetical protein